MVYYVTKNYRKNRQDRDENNIPFVQASTQNTEYIRIVAKFRLFKVAHFFQVFSTFLTFISGLLERAIAYQ